MSDDFRTPYPGWDVLSKWDGPSYNDQTREVLRHRLSPPPRRALEPALYAVLEALCDRVIPQEGEERAEIAPWIDAAIHEDRPTGTRYEGMPDNPSAWRIGLAALDAEARARNADGFAAMPAGAQDALLRDVDGGETRAAEAWDGLRPRKFLRHTALKQIVEFYYAHPKGQSEIGYGGPASPRGYLRLGADRIDGWEAPRGEWPDEPGRDR